MNKLFLIIAGICMYQMASAQSNSTDTVIVKLAKTSQLTLTIGDPDDLRLLQHYDFEALFDDMLSRLAENHDIELNDDADEDMDTDDFDDDGSEDEEDYEDDGEEDDGEEDDGGEDDEDEDEDQEDDSEDYEHNDNVDDDENDGKWSHTKDRIFGLVNVDFGISNYHSRTVRDLPDSGDEQYVVRPWGSWYIALNSIHHTHLDEDFRIDWGVGLSWYNFKFQDDRTVLSEASYGAVFTRDERDLEFIKSKLTVAYVNASIIPVIQFGRHRDHSGVLKHHHRDFRIGAGVYGGYRLGSYTKQVYEEDDDREKERVRDDFFLSNLRYGLRLQFGIHNTDFFFNYDLNDLFRESRVFSGNHIPQLKAYSFGVLF